MEKNNIKDNKIRDLLLNQKGMALLTTLIFIFILVTFAVALLVMTSNDTKLSALQRDSTKAFYIAEAGIERTLYDLKEEYNNDRNWADGSINGHPLSEDMNGFRKIDYDSTGVFDVPFGEGTYTVYLIDLTSDSVTIKSEGVHNNKSTRYIQVDAKAGPLSVWDNAIFAGTGAYGRVINGNVDIRGSVHVLGEAGQAMEWEIEIGGTGGIGNNYLGMDSDLRDRILELDTRTLNAKLHVKHGKVNLSGNATVGNPDVPENDYKEWMDGVFIDEGGDDIFGGNQGASNVYSDNGAEEAYYFGEMFEFPDLYEDDYIDVTTGETVEIPYSGGELYKYDGYYNSGNTLKITDISSISSDTESFWYPDPENEVPPDPINLPLVGDYIYWHKEESKLYIQGIIVIEESIEDFTIGDKGNPIEYVGVGTIVSKGDISIHSDLLAKGLEKFPRLNALGLVAYNDINIATGPGDSQLEMMGAFYAEDKITSAKQNQMAGTFVSDYFDMGINVPSIYQVPGLEDYLPPGMPGAVGPTVISTSNWHEVHE